MAVFGFEREVEWEWCPHLVSEIMSDFLFTHTDASTLRQALAQRASRIAALPFIDSAHVRWVHGSVLVAEYLLLHEAGPEHFFSTSQAYGANFRPTVGLT